MKKRIGTKLYDTDKGIIVLPEMGLYKQPLKRSFYLFDGEKITPVEYAEAEKMIRGTGDADLLQYLEVKPNVRGCATVGVTIEHYRKLEKYAKEHGVSMKKVIEDFIDSLPSE